VLCHFHVLFLWLELGQLWIANNFSVGSSGPPPPPDISCVARCYGACYIPLSNLIDVDDFEYMVVPLWCAVLALLCVDTLRLLFS
jgi:hypothetical protein